ARGRHGGVPRFKRDAEKFGFASSAMGSKGVEERMCEKARVERDNRILSAGRTARYGSSQLLGSMEGVAELGSISSLEGSETVPDTEMISQYEKDHRGRRRALPPATLTHSLPYIPPASKGSSSSASERQPRPGSGKKEGGEGARDKADRAVPGRNKGVSRKDRWTGPEGSSGGTLSRRRGDSSCRGTSGGGVGDSGGGGSSADGSRKRRQPCVVALVEAEHELDLVKKLCARLGQKHLYTTVTADATHVVVGRRFTTPGGVAPGERSEQGEGKKAKKGQGKRVRQMMVPNSEGAYHQYLTAVMLGLWIVDFSWVKDCLGDWDNSDARRQAVEGEWN
ncbi:unnamed protein product, partial [Discosporangium mesarthrocarpum]